MQQAAKIFIGRISGFPVFDSNLTSALMQPFSFCASTSQIEFAIYSSITSCAHTISFKFYYYFMTYRPIRNVIPLIQILWEWNVLFIVFPYHLNVNATLSCKCKDKEREIWIRYNNELAESVYIYSFKISLSLFLNYRGDWKRQHCRKRLFKANVCTILIMSRFFFSPSSSKVLTKCATAWREETPPG